MHYKLNFQTILFPADDDSDTARLIIKDTAVRHYFSNADHFKMISEYRSSKECLNLLESKKNKIIMQFGRQMIRTKKKRDWIFQKPRERSCYWELVFKMYSVSIEKCHLLNFG